MPPSCALLGGFSISARVALLWRTRTHTHTPGRIWFGKQAISLFVIFCIDACAGSMLIALTCRPTCHWRWWIWSEYRCVNSAAEAACQVKPRTLAVPRYTLWICSVGRYSLPSAPPRTGGAPPGTGKNNCHTSVAERQISGHYMTYHSAYNSPVGRRVFLGNPL